MRLRTAIFAIGLAPLAPVVAWAAFKPMRVLAPELLGLQCTESHVCVDDPARLVEAVKLRNDAVAFVNDRVGPLGPPPRVVFCSTPECAKSYGFTSQGAYSVGTIGVAISPRGWHDYFLRHELIHQVQAQRFGSLTAWLFKPNWLLEGMAYSLSEDPRRPLPAPLEGWRSHFEGWYSSVGTSKLWQAADAE